MALFTDGPVAALTDLRAYESSVLDMASTEAIDLTVKLQIAHREANFEVSCFLVRHGYNPPTDLAKVVATEPMLHFETLRALELTFRDAYNSQLNDRYLGKWREYAELSRRAMTLMFDIGIGMSYAPMPRAAAPVWATVPGGLLPARTYFVSIAWQTPAGVTGDWSSPIAVPVDELALLTLTPPAAASGATGYFVYAGTSVDDMRRQNELAVAPAAAWTEAPAGLRADLAAIARQTPDWYITNRRLLRRG